MCVLRPIWPTQWHKHTKTQTYTQNTRVPAQKNNKPSSWQLLLTLKLTPRKQKYLFNPKLKSKQKSKGNEKLDMHILHFSSTLSNEAYFRGNVHNVIMYIYCIYFTIYFHSYDIIIPLVSSFFTVSTFSLLDSVVSMCDVFT